MRLSKHYARIVPEGYDTLLQLQDLVNHSGIEPKLLHLVALRASQINGCAFCLNLHTKEALTAGDDPQRLACLAGWKDAPFFTPRECAALAWCEAVTRLPESHAPDDVFDGLQKVFEDKEIVFLTFAVGLINIWNRLGVGFRIAPERQSHQSQ